MKKTELNEKWLLIKGANGMGNRIFSLLEGIVYAKLTNRKIVVDWRDEIYSNNKENSFLYFFKNYFDDLSKINRNGTVFPKIWKNNLDKSLYDMFRNEGIKNSLDGWEKFSIDINNTKYNEDVLIFIAFEFGKMFKFYKLLPREWPKDKINLIKFLLNKYIYLTEEITKEVNSFKEKNFKDNVIGVHVRYTDNMNKKFIHYKGTDLDSFFPIIDNLLLKNKNSKIFLATDNKSILDLFKNKYSNILYFDKYFDIENGAIHYSKNCDKKIVAKESLIDLHLLAKCNYLVYSENSSYGRLASLLSITNPSKILKVKRYTNFKNKIISPKYIRKEISRNIDRVIGIFGKYIKFFSPKLHEKLKNIISNKKIIVYCDSGLCNRLRALFSAKYSSDILNKDMEFIWIKNSSCGAEFSDLFENTEFNITNNYSLWKKIFFKELDFSRDKNTQKIPIDILKYNTKNKIIHTYISLFSPRDFPYHDISLRESNKIFNILKPIKYVRDEVENFTTKNFKNKIMGVHIRRGDFILYFKEKTQNLDSFIKEMDNFLRINPQGKFFVSTDDGSKSPNGTKIDKENVIDFLINRYGENKILQYIPRSLERMDKESIQDALINLLILRKTDEFIGNQYSSFSEMAMINRDIPQKRV